MSMQQNTTYSMIVAQLLNQEREMQGLNQSEFFKNAKLSQSSWSRINRGLSHFTLEELRATCSVLSLEMTKLLGEADKITKLLPDREDVAILDTVKGSDNKSILPTIIAGAALAFLISRLLQK